jgi:hypothetical protein
LEDSPSINGSFAKMGDYLPLNSERLKLTESYIVSNTKIKKALQKSLPVSAKRTIKTIKSFKQ